MGENQIMFLAKFFMQKALLISDAFVLTKIGVGSPNCAKTAKYMQYADLVEQRLI